MAETYCFDLTLKNIYLLYIMSCVLTTVPPIY